MGSASRLELQHRQQQLQQQCETQGECAKVTGSLDAMQVLSTTSSSAAARSTTPALCPRPPWGNVPPDQAKGQSESVLKSSWTNQLRHPAVQTKFYTLFSVAFTFTFFLSYHHSSPITIAVILPSSNHHLDLNVIEAVKINWNKIFFGIFC